MGWKDRVADELLGLRPKRLSRKAKRRRAKNEAQRKRVTKLRALSYDQYLRSKHWQHKRKRALSVHGESCRLCGSEEALCVHHTHYFSLGKEKLRHLVVLCNECHSDWHCGRLESILCRMDLLFDRNGDGADRIRKVLIYGEGIVS